MRCCGVMFRPTPSFSNVRQVLSFMCLASLVGGLAMHTHRACTQHTPSSRTMDPAREVCWTQHNYTILRLRSNNNTCAAAEATTANHWLLVRVA